MKQMITEKCKSRCVIINNRIELDDEVLFSALDEMPVHEFLTEAYRALRINYPKFFKMDLLSKTAFLGMEVLMRKIGDTIDRDHIPVILHNTSSSIDVDTQFQKTMESLPSPSLFVYTLPNVMIGEICIRHKLYGENYLFVIEKQNGEEMLKNMRMLLRGQEVDECIMGYVEAKEGKVECLVLNFDVILHSDK